MGAQSSQDQGWKNQVHEIIDETKSKIQKINPFSKIQDQVPYAQPLQSNIYAPSQQYERKATQIIEQQIIKKPKILENDNSYQYDQKYWKKQHPNVVIQGHWFKRTPHGHCKLYFPGGKQIFVAYFYHGMPLFQDCLIVFEDGSYYHGKLTSFRMHGYGKYVNSDKTLIVEGQWFKGFPVGKVKQTIFFENEQIQFEGEFNENSEKSGANCSYTIQSRLNQRQMIIDYKGGFKNDGFYGPGQIKASNNKFSLKGSFDQQKITIKNFNAESFQFYGQMDKRLDTGKGKFTDLSTKTSSKIVYEGEISGGLLNGPGSITNQKGQQQKVYWFDGIKLRHLRNFKDSTILKQMLQQIQQQYRKANSYTQLTKALTLIYSQNLKNKKRYIFEMISQEKVNIIVKKNEQQNNGQNGNSKVEMKNEFIIELEKGRFLYVSCYNRDRE